MTQNAGVLGLITRRSQVQILSPLPCKFKDLRLLAVSPFFCAWCTFGATDHRELKKYPPVRLADAS